MAYTGHDVSQEGGEMFQIWYPNTAAVFDDGNGLPAMKVYLGISTDEAFARAMKQEGKGPLAIFWMANPENPISLPLADIRSLAPVVGTIDCERGCVHSRNRPSL